MRPNLFAICGKRAILEALSSQRPHAFRSLCIAKERDRDDEVVQILKLANRRSIPLQKMEIRELDRFVPRFTNHQGLILLLKEAPRPDSLERVMEKALSQEPFHMLGLDCVLDHRNIGALTRSAVAFGFKAILAQQDRSAPLIHPAVWRTSQGAAEHIHFIQVVNLSRTLEKLKENGFWIVGAIADSEAEDVRAVKEWPKKLCLVFGSEEKGLRRLTAEHCDIKVKIPMAQAGYVDSLNIASAATILLWEIFKSSK